MKPLEGIRVVDLADEKGELCGRFFADLGADVIRIEPSSGSISRTLEPFAPDGETSLYFAVRNAGKRGMRADLDTAEGRERLDALLADADLLIETFRPSEARDLGLAPERIAERFPQLVHLSITDFGHTGPYKDWLGSDMIGFALGGLMIRAGIFEKPPLVAPGALAYDTSAFSAAYGALLGLYKRLRTGKGQHIDTSVMESVANLSDWSLPNFSQNPGVGPRAGAGIYTLYRCSDGFIRMIILVTRHWHALLEWIGKPEALADPSYEVFLNRLVNMDKIVPVIEGFFRDKKKVEVAEEAQRRSIPATPLLEPAEVLANHHFAARGTFRTLEVAAGVEAQVASGFITIDGERVGPSRRAPRVGEHDGEGFAGDEEARRALAAGAGEAPADGHPLRGIRVIDFGVGAVGVEVGRQLAEFGADVIKIETRRAPDFIRVIVNSWMNPSFASSSRSKRSIGIDVKQERGLDLVKQLIADADVVIENNGGGVMDRLGLGPDALRKVNPGIVSFSSQMAGSTGPWKDWIGYGPNTHPLSGLQYLWNYPEDAAQPAGSTNVYPDHFVGRIGAASVMAGLIQRVRTGRGMHTDAAQYEAATNLLADLMAKESLVPGSVQPQGNARGRGAPWGPFQCAGEDEWCAVTVWSDPQWQGLRAAMGDPEWARDPALDTGDGRIARREAIHRAVDAWMQTLPPQEAMETLQSHGVPAGVLCHGGHHMGDPHLAARGYAKLIDQPELGALLFEGPPFVGSDLPDPIEERAPRLGEHTREIAADLLGLTSEQIEKLIADNVLEDPPEGLPSEQAG
jgi:crotonobetainyl-CoA:carnitine CoA-transferase CaiB-like acyl-CoA transferase